MVDGEGRTYGNQLSHLCIYSWLFGADDEGDAKHCERLMGLNKDFNLYGIHLSRYRYDHGSSGDVDQYRLSHQELFLVGVQSDDGWKTVLNNLAKGLRLYLGEEYSVEVEKRRLKILRIS